ncbi:hypothetical protein C8A00DRAFT_19749 [Chaetomidium leptoderma]|uniref:Chromo domain-containing protein n=1 Tax=Chaetomidium leptoderma TaxID=669021 RepID=A0AAN6VC96_9PEZI|nr:hypothetical protein C8A00DRAFT_19749 [Chaetomidium leptoderma]
MVRPYNPVGIPGQEQAQSEVHANRGRVVTRTDDGVESQEWRFERILDCGKADNGRWQYLVKWDGYEEPTWQPATDLRGCDDAIWEFHDSHPEAPGPPSWVPRCKGKTAASRASPTMQTEEGSGGQRNRRGRPRAGAT